MGFLTEREHGIWSGEEDMSMLERVRLSDELTEVEDSFPQTGGENCCWENSWDCVKRVVGKGVTCSCE